MRRFALSARLVTVAKVSRCCVLSYGYLRTLFSFVTLFFSLVGFVHFSLALFVHLYKDHALAFSSTEFSETTWNYLHIYTLNTIMHLSGDFPI
jgi:hypothetical protein